MVVKFIIFILWSLTICFWITHLIGYITYNHTSAYDKEKADYCLTVVFITGVIINILGLITILLP